MGEKKTVQVVMLTESHNLPRGSKVEVSRERADELIANNQAREA